MKLSLCITSFNRTNLVIESFSRVYDNPQIDEIVIVDDASTEENFRELDSLLAINDTLHKIHLFRNEKNLGMSLNKREAISRAKNEWCILLDSDNILYPEYLKPFEGAILQPGVIYCPEKAEPDYDFSELPAIIDKNNAKDLLHKKEFRIMLNTCNYVVNRSKYLEVYRYDESIKESDTIYFNELWLRAGYSFMIVMDMKYYHRRHEGSGWLMGDHEYNLKKAAELQEKIKLL
jgi:glycosyltransferase involved in cell wall biosynthesis